MSNEVFDSSDTILIKSDKIAAPSHLKENLLGPGKKIQKLSKETQLQSITSAYENFFLHDLEKMIAESNSAAAEKIKKLLDHILKIKDSY